MTQAEATALTAKLVAAFPYPKVEPLTIGVYTEQIQRLPLFDAGVEAIDAIIANEDRLPRVVLIRDTYERVKGKYQPLALREPDLTPAQVAENLRQCEAMLGRLTAKHDRMPGRYAATTGDRVASEN